MQYEMSETNKEHFHFGHVGMVLFVAVLLVGVSWMKNPDLFDVFKSSSPGSSTAANLPRYYAYEPPAEFSQPLVAGASTEGQGPMIISEDGSLTPAVEPGDVLGASTADLNLDLSSIVVGNTTDNSPEKVQFYIKQVGEVEDNYINNLEFESALTSLSPTMVAEQTKKMQKISDGLESLTVPLSLVDFHKFKILQYRSGIEILKYILSADENPEAVTAAFSKFLQAQEGLEQESLKLQEKF